jgi:transcriptional regulator with XRE-family HTH domain
MASNATTKPSNSGLGELLRISRERAGLKLKDVADRSGASVTTLSLLERGQRQVPPDVLERIVASTGADASEAFRLAGIASPQAVSELSGGELIGALDRGGLSGAARSALRRAHLSSLAEAVRTTPAFPPVDMERLLDDEFGIDIRSSDKADKVRFATPELVEYPAELDEEEHRRERQFALGHMAAHALISRPAGRRPECSLSAGGVTEGEATWVAGLLLMPRRMLESEAQLLVGTYKVTESSGLSNFINEVASAFAVPAWVAARHLGDAGLLAWAAGMEEI